MKKMKEARKSSIRREKRNEMAGCLKRNSKWTICVAVNVYSLSAISVAGSSSSMASLKM